MSESPEWIVVHGRDDGVEGYALRQVAGLLQGHLSRPVALERATSVSAEALRQNLVVIGTVASNPFVADLKRKGLLRVESAVPEFVSIRVVDSPLSDDRQMVVLAGSDENGVLYAVRDFEHYVVPPGRAVNGAGKETRTPFRNRFPSVEMTGAPVIQHRGLWTWGHVVYDWRRYIDNMSRWKMNTLVLWNDHCPVNAAEIVSYAHSRGVKVVWGYSWGWGEEVDPTSGEETAKWARRALEQYRDGYALTGCDGIYFQAFTETNDTELRGHTIAELAVRWVNAIAERLLEEFPELWILFGLHATSIKDDYPVLSQVNRNIAIVWEDIGGPPPPFPYAYEPGAVAGVQEALAYTSRIARLRGAEERTGIVVKGMTNLDWETFKHQPGRLVLGEWPQDYVERRSQEKTARWRVVELEWRRSLPYLLDAVRAIAEARPLQSCVLGLVEDGMWEARMWLPVALLAEGTWNPRRAPDELVLRVSSTNDAFCLC